MTNEEWLKLHPEWLKQETKFHVDGEFGDFVEVIGSYDKPIVGVLIGTSVDLPKGIVVYTVVVWDEPNKTFTIKCCDEINVLDCSMRNLFKCLPQRFCYWATRIMERR